MGPIRRKRFQPSYRECYPITKPPNHVPRPERGSAVDLRNKWILLTGASAGLGEQLALKLAKNEGAKLVLVARRRDRLEDFAVALRKLGRDVHVIPADLSRPNEASRIYAEVKERGLTLDAMILNAGITYFGPHSELSAEDSQKLLNTNLTSVVELSTLFVNELKAIQKPGALLLISSLAGSIPLPYQAIYSGTKAFLTHFGQALAYELRNENISLTVFAPGGIATEMPEVSGLNSYFKDSFAMMSAERCAEFALKAFLNKKTFAIPGWSNRWSARLARFAGNRIATRCLGPVYERALRSKNHSRVK